ncbi:MAG: hypothetical protein J0I09_02755 [Sphingobacteriia bacterium]|nr:hypothetical protein [Sphingobacteriia bacterium]
MDSKIRNAFEQFSDSSFVPDWRQLEQKLDIEMPVKKKRRRFVIFWVVLAISSVGISYLWYSAGHNYKIHNLSVTKTSTQNDESAEVSQLSPEKKETSDNLPSVQKKTKEQQSLSLNSPSKINNSNDPVGGNTFPISLSNKSDKKNTWVKLSGNKKVYNKENTEKIAATDYLQIVEPKKQIVDDSYLASDDLYDNNKAPKSFNDSITTALSSLPKDDLIEKSNSGSRANQRSKLNNRITFTLSGGTNFNSVQLNKPSRAGYDYGLLLGYRISQKFEIRSGIFLSKKYFKTDGSVLSFDSAKLNLPSYNSIKLEDATGYCRFVEIPVMLYYRFHSKGKTNFFAAGGFSVSKMRMENIDYIFLADGSTVIERSHANAYHKNSDASTLLSSNFALGINRSISKVWNLSVEAYTKFPLTRFNDNNLRFSTFGISLSATYNLPTKR